MLAGNRVEFKTKVAGISRGGSRLTLGTQPAGPPEAMHEGGCEGGHEMAALVQPVKADFGTNNRMDLDNATFEALVNAQYEPLYRFAFSLAGHEAEARDLTQEAFAQLARKAGQIQDRSKSKSWLFTTLYRAFVDSRRWKTRHPHVEVDTSEGELPVTLPNAAERLDAVMALQALRQVPEVYRAPLTLFYLEQHSYLEIAEILEVPPGTVMSRISRGRALLRQLMEDKPRNIVPLETLKPSAVS